MIKTMVFLLVLGTVSAAAQSRHAVKPIDGYSCMNLNVPTGYLYEHRNVGVPEYAGPSLSSPIVNPNAPAVVVVRNGSARDGFLQAIQPNGTLVWLEVRYLHLWSNPYAPSARCQPSVMSDGSIGTGP